MIEEVHYSVQNAQTWLLVSGATFHVTPNIKWFSNYSVDASGTIRLGNMITLHQVRHVPDLKRRSVSIGMLAEDGYGTTLNESEWMITRGNLRIGNGHKYNNLYPMMTINPEGAVNVAEKTYSNLWHSRLGHMSQAELDRLMAIGYIPKLQTKTNFCEHCQYRNKPEVRTLFTTKQYISP